MSGHTPGPWKAHSINTTRILPFTPISAKTMLAMVYSEAFGDHEQSEANARLMAAAPDLLEALQEFVSISADPAGFYSEMVQKNDEQLQSFIEAQEARVQEAIKAARIAIAKATGGAP